jgi:hypothetical protein
VLVFVAVATQHEATKPKKYEEAGFRVIPDNPVIP